MSTQKLTFSPYFRIASGLLALIFLLSVGAAVLFLNSQVTQINRELRFQEAGFPFPLSSLVMKNGTVKIHKSTLDLIEKSGGWIQILNEKGEAKHSNYTPSDVPRIYHPGELAAYLTQPTNLPYKIYIWNEKIDKINYTIIYGLRYKSYELLKKVKDEATLNGDKIELPEGIDQELTKSKGWVQVIDEVGGQIASKHKPKKIPTSYSPQQLARMKTNLDDPTIQTYSSYDADSKLTWIVQTPTNYPKSGIQKIKQKQMIIFSIVGGLLIIVNLGSLGILLWLSNRYISRPTDHIFEWIAKAKTGKFVEPIDQNNTPRSLMPTGVLRPEYNMYKEVLNGLYTVTESLKRNSGSATQSPAISASLAKYIKVLVEQTDRLSRNDVRKIGTILMKAMQSSDSSSNASSTNQPSSSKAELNELLKKTLMFFKQHPQYQDVNFGYRPSEQPVHHSLNPENLRRILESIFVHVFLGRTTPRDLILGVRTRGPQTFSILMQSTATKMEVAQVQKLLGSKKVNKAFNGSEPLISLAEASKLLKSAGGEVQIMGDATRGVLIEIKFSL